MTSLTTPVRRPARFSAADCRLEDFRQLVERQTELADYPFAREVSSNVLIYDGDGLRRDVLGSAGSARREELEAELVRALTDGPGVVVFTGAYRDLDTVDRVTASFEAIIAEERATGGDRGDHFAKAGANDRVWNALEKLAVRDPEAFVDYYGNDILELISTAWLGPGYQLTSQVNVVRPGGVAQDPHRDYHLGFLSDEVSAAYPAHVHLLSPVLTLQGAVAHSDMPVESGPTMYLPYSQRYEPGYLAWRRPEFADYFAARHVQLPLHKGDAAFFNPALFHGAGSNVSTDVQRMANLLQVSSAFGRAMETVDRTKISTAIYPPLRNLSRTDPAAAGRALACAAEGYPFPTNLDLDHNVDGLTPPSQAQVIMNALAADWDPERLSTALADHDRRRRTEEI